MKVHLSFDVEVWCNGWQQLDARFPAAFERYVYGHSATGDYALPATLDILNRHGLRAVFFVEPLFSARFGAQYLQRIVELIEGAGQEVQLHLHPEWTDELASPPIADAGCKRQHLTYYSLLEQSQLICYGLALLRAQAQRPITVFRAGSYAANLDTYQALEANGLYLDSSLNEAAAISGTGLPGGVGSASAQLLGGVQVFPVSTFTDGLGRLRPAQVGACSLGEMTQALDRAAALGRSHFVIVSHNFEMLRPGSSAPDSVVVRRFEGLCRHLARHPVRFEVCGFSADPLAAGDSVQSRPRVAPWATVQRLGEQAWRRLA